MTLNSSMTLLLLCSMVTVVLGCQKPESELTIGAGSTKVDVTDVDIKLGKSEDGKLSVAPKRNIPVRGSFRLKDPNQVALPVVAQVIRLQNGKRVIESSVVIPTKKDGDRIAFDGSLTAPDKVGDFTFEILEGDQELVKQEINISK